MGSPQLPKNAHFKGVLSFFLVPFFLILFSFNSFGQFQRISGDKGLNVLSNTSGGQAWGDLNEDGYPDVILWSTASGNQRRSSMYFNSGPPNFTFQDTTLGSIDGFDDNIFLGRQLLIADFNGDGLNDVLRGGGGNSIVEVYFNNGAPNYTFGNASQQPHFVITRSLVTDGAEYNMEGVGAIDWNQDGLLDILMDNDGGSNDIFQNNGDSTFTYINPGTAAGETGFPAGHAGSGDYLTLADINNDGFVDFYGRKTNVNNYWRFDPDSSRFINQSAPNIVSLEDDKGGTMFCDFDSDGDLDLLWTSHGTNQIWRNDGKDVYGDDVWTPTTLPGGAIATQTGIDGCDCGDVDNDGDVDIILGAGISNSYLLENQLMQSGTMSFNTTNINTSTNTEGLVLVDFDVDGDLDLYFTANDPTNGNQLWENTTNNTNYCFVNIETQNDDLSYRHAIGANVVLLDCDQNTVGMRQVNGSKGHGTQHYPKVHFGVDPNETYTAVAYFVYEDGSRDIIKRNVRPADYTNQTFTIRNTDSSDATSNCSNDSDGDGVSDDLELDSDNDGVPNAVEVTCGNGDLSNGGTYSHQTTLVSGSSEVALMNNITAVITNTATTGTLNNYRFLTGSIANSTDGSLSDGLEIDYTGSLAQIEISIDFSQTIGGLGMDIGDLDIETIDSIKVWNASNEIQLGINNFTNIGANVNYQGNALFSPFGSSDLPYTDNSGSFRINISESFDQIVIYTKGTEAKLTLTAVNYCDYRDTDGDKTPDFLDLDSDNDGIPDLVEAGGIDTDGDGMTDDNNDSDGDGLADQFDNNDTDGPTGDGSNTTDPSTSILLDADQNGVNELGDQDGDGIFNFYDLDADNDGIPDIVEVGGIDGDGNGRLDNVNPDSTLINDLDEDGFADVYDPDNDLVAGIDLNGSIQPLVETDGSAEQFDGLTGITQDIDGDGIPNYLDLDSDNDGISDLVEVYGVDIDGDGKVVTTGNWDLDGNGLADMYDRDALAPGTPLVETTSDDGNGHLDGTESFIAGTAGFELDPDNDGFASLLDLDADNDGIVDVREAGGADSDSNGLADDGSGNWVDVNENGLHDDFEGEITTTADGTDANSIPDFTTGVGEKDLDADGLANWIDIDADNDGIVDNTEAQATGSYVAPGIADSDFDGLLDAYDNAIGSFAGNGVIPTNTDGTDTPDYLDLDADNDGELDSLEGHDTDNDGSIDSNPITSTGTATGVDADNDGLDDGYDMDAVNFNPTNSGSEPLDYPETDNLTADMDWRSANGNFGGTVWYDIDEDGIRAGTETLLANVTVTLFNSLGASQGTTQTDVNGNFLFNDLLPGNYYVFVAMPTAYNLYSPADQGGDDTVDSDVVGQTGNTVQYTISTGTPEVNASAGVYSGSLPVVLSYFEAESRGCNVLMKWQTESEIGFKEFIIQRSVDGNAYQNIHTIQSSNKAEGSFYIFKDENAQKRNFYRLKMVDLDGSIRFSQVSFTTTDCSTEVGIIDLYPNPIKGKGQSIINARIYSDTEDLNLMISDRLGRVLREMKYSTHLGWKTIQVDVSGLPDGMYFLISKDVMNIPAKRFLIVN